RRIARAVSVVFRTPALVHGERHLRAAGGGPQPRVGMLHEPELFQKSTCQPGIDLRLRRPGDAFAYADRAEHRISGENCRARQSGVAPAGRSRFQVSGDPDLDADSVPDLLAVAELQGAVETDPARGGDRGP